MPAAARMTAEMDHLPDCIRNNREVHASGAMGLADLRIIEAIGEAARAVRVG